MVIIMNKKLSILGSTGSIGKQALEVSKKCGFEVTAITASSSAKELENQIREFRPKLAAL
ncbi:MAG: 1-deoxy-D-xylulose-5-phosphate reductoisomerase, partial [Oscillospiraceae bacterium]